MQSRIGTDAGRVPHMDVARFYGIALVYYGHFIESMMNQQNPTAALHYKFVYSFHMVLFFVIAGFVVNESRVREPFGSYLRYHVISRLAPYLLFSLLLVVPTFWFAGNTVGLDLSTSDGYIKGLMATVVGGFPAFNVPTWFLILLLMVELIHFAVFRWLGSDRSILLAAAGFYVAGYLISWQFDLYNPLKGRMFSYFMLQEAVTVYAFYLFGIYLRRRGFLLGRVPVSRLLGGAVLAFLLVLFTFDLNRGLFSFHLYDAVVILFSSHGHFLLFPFTAIVGSLLVLLLGRLSAGLRPLAWLGRNVLVIFCLNGVFYHFINDRLARWMLERFSNEPPAILLGGIVVTICSLALTVPFILLFNRTIPQLVGKPRVSGPILRKLA